MSQKYITKDTAFVHVRRGDYLLIQNLYKQPEMEYYKKCVNILKRKNKNIRKIFIFSNDIKYVKSRPYFNNPIFQIIQEHD